MHSKMEEVFCVDKLDKQICKSFGFTVAPKVYIKNKLII